MNALLPRLYPGVSDALKFASSRVYIVTTKQVWPSLFASNEEKIVLTIDSFRFNIKENRGVGHYNCTCYSFFTSSCPFPSIIFLGFQSRFADALLRELAGVTMPPERIYGLGTGLVSDITGIVWHFDSLIEASIIVSFFSPLFISTKKKFVNNSIFSSPKTEVLKQLQKMPEHQGLKLQ